MAVSNSSVYINAICQRLAVQELCELLLSLLAFASFQVSYLLVGSNKRRFRRQLGLFHYLLLF